MKDVIYLRVNRNKVIGMTKTLPSIYRGEIPIKVNVTVNENAFREPVIQQSIVVNDWQDGIDLADVEFKQNIITPEEAEAIRQRRLEKMQEILTQNGFTIIKQPNDSSESESER